MTETWNEYTQEQKQAAGQFFDALSTLDSLGEDRIASSGLQRITGFSDLYKAVSEPDFTIGVELVHALREDGKLSETFKRLLEKHSSYHFQQAVAASSGLVETREGDGFRITLRKSRAEPSQLYVLIHLKGGVSPKSMFIINPNFPGQKHNLPTPHDGVIQILSETNSNLVKALQDIQTEVFLK